MDEPTETKNKKRKYKQGMKHERNNQHKARLIVRNLPFSTTEDNLREHFEKFGEIDEVKLLKKEDGMLLGCGFVQFKLKQKAAKARHHLNGKPFLDRNIKCDWAVPKDKYEKGKGQNWIKEETPKIKEEPMDDGYEVKQEVDDVTEIKEDIKEETDDVKNEQDIDMKQINDTSIDDENSDEDDLDDEEYDIEESQEDDDLEIIDTKTKVSSNDVVEGKTVFIKNVPFSATNDDVSKRMSEFGPLYYAVVCIDQLTEHSRGTAFVKFKNKDDADKCIADKTVTLMGNLVECESALSREEVKNKFDKQAKGPRDSRNLYLVKEGVILAGSKAAQSVSAADMAKRLQIEQYKTQMLRNLSMFVAKTRLVIHNIPANWNDAQLRKLIQKHSSPDAVIKEARIMRNMRSLDAKGIGKSKEYGFVTFTTHEAALKVLRSLNNNPNIFNVNKRPIVAFSIENKSKLQAKEKRLVNSKLKNPHSKSYDPKAVFNNQKKDKNKPYSNSKQSDKKDESLNKFSGVTASYGNNKMRSKFNLKTQAQVHLEQVKKDKKKKKMALTNLPLKQKQKKLKASKQKTDRRKTDDNFSKLVNVYKEKVLSTENTSSGKRKKWYE